MKTAEISGIVINYLLENRDAFNDAEVNMILSNMNLEDTFYSIPNIVLQLYDELGILPDDINSYKAFSELINEQFDIKDKNIVEIGGGVLPRLGKRLSLMQDRGTVTVYDPNLYLNKAYYPNLKLIKRKFFPITNVDMANVLVGLLPCGSSSSIIKSAIKHNKDFMIALCDSCNYLEYFDGYEEDPDWPNNFIMQTAQAIEENNMGKLKVKHLKEVGLQYPIIYNDRG